MLINPGPTSNTERQRQFRARNPGYYGRLHRRRSMTTMIAQAPVAVTPAAVAMIAIPDDAPTTTLSVSGFAFEDHPGMP